MTELEKAIEEFYWERNLSIVRTYLCLEHVRIDALGNIAGYDGQITLKRMLLYFEKLEMYEWCAMVRDLLSEYIKKFGDGYSKSKVELSNTETK